MTHIYLIRHGQASAGTDHYDRLSALGRRQSSLLGNWWQRTGFRADRAFSGTLERQQDTASLSLEAAGLDTPTQVIAGLDEYDHHTIDRLFGEGARSDMPLDMTFERYVEIMRRWHEADPGILDDDAEAWHEFEQRGWSSIQHAHELADGHANLLLYTSGGVIATILRHVLKLDFEATMDMIWRIRNASVTSLHYRDNQARLIDFNTVPHLHMEADPELVTLI